MEPLFRTCCAEDVEAAVPLIYSSGPAQFRYVFSEDYEEQALDFLKYVFVQPKGEFGFENHTAVIVDGEQVGVAAMWTSAKNLEFLLTSARQIFSYYGLLKGMKVVVRGLKIENVITQPSKGISYIGNVGIAESMRGRGLGRALLEQLFEQTKALGLSKTSLDVEIENRRAKKLYESMGFVDAKENASDLKSKYGYVLTHFYMKKDLG